MESVGDKLRRMLAKEDRLTTVEEGWERFLGFLKDRHGVVGPGISRIDPAEFEELLEYVENRHLDPDSRRDDEMEGRLEAFGRREDVIKAFEIFFKEPW